MQKLEYKKIIQVVNFFAKKEGGTIDKLKLIKLVWLADRYHLRKFGRLITNDQYWAMPYGPVASNTKDLVGNNVFWDDKEKSYIERYFKIQGDRIKTIKDCDFDFFSETDIKSIEDIYEKYGKYKASTLVTFSHKFPEWKKNENKIKGGNTRELMNYEDFFLNPEGEINFPENIFNESSEELCSSKRSFEIFYQNNNCWN
ncbi:MAG: Panacea domain-containing protein [Bacilli bacterium]|nr:Panacea domain-containing protein [Bacilli bacterium]